MGKVRVGMGDKERLRAGERREREREKGEGCMWGQHTTKSTRPVSPCPLQIVRSEVEYTQQLCDTCAKELVQEFNDW